MSKRIRKIMLLPLVMLVSCLGAFRATGQNSDGPVITTIEDFEEAIAPTLQIRSDGFGVYRNSREVQSIIQSVGDWVLATNTKFSTRMVYLDFSQPVPGSGPSGGDPILLPPGTYKARLTMGYLDRIASLNPLLHAVIETNPDAVSIAARLDNERRSGMVRGPLHGIPVLVKDNIATKDNMQTTAGSLALFGSQVPADAVVVNHLRAAGAVILGKANLSEWANFRGIGPIDFNGWSARGGKTRDPYLLSFDPCGSSSGSAVAAAANLCGTVGSASLLHSPENPEIRAPTVREGGHNRWRQPLPHCRGSVQDFHALLRRPGRHGQPF